LFFVLSILLLVVSSLAWFASNNQADVDEVVQTIGKYDVDVTLEVMTSHQTEYVVIETDEQLATLLGNSLPNDAFSFKLTIVNQSTSNIDFSVIFSDFLSVPSVEGYDMLDVFCLVNGAVEIQDESEATIDEVVLPYISDEIVTIGEVELQLYRFSNLASNGRLLFLSDVALPYEGTRVLLFTIKFDENTENAAFEQASFSINTIEIFLK
jgi:hypothetical protein